MLAGAGQIGGTLAHLAMLQRLGDIVLLDVTQDLRRARRSTRPTRRRGGHRCFTARHH
ncbi:hypothetical protein OZ411_07010 [Bradyrhizobium sp. Arg237L]|nr:hypothetical protein [Bradyrhizobium sp. Arg237L]MDI4232560.1 hypothetical protein [Bradyrhizobium sp. Arg237L]